MFVYVIINVTLTLKATYRCVYDVNPNIRFPSSKLFITYTRETES
jgi:hypothetical protein